MKQQNKLILWLSWRYFWTKRKAKQRSGTKLAILGIALGVMALTVTMAVMNGLQMGYINTILEMGGGHAQVYSRGWLPNETLEQWRSSGDVQAIEPWLEATTMIRSEAVGYRGLSVQAVQADILERDAGFMRAIQLASAQLPADKGEIALGSRLAAKLQVQVGDTVWLLSLPVGTLQPSEVAFTVVDLFTSGYFDYDSSWAYISLAQMLAIASQEKEISYTVKLKNRWQDRVFLATLHQMGFDGASWRQYNRTFFNVLKLEKNMMQFLLSLIFLVTAINIYQGRVRYIIAKQQELAILRTQGLNPEQMMWLFSWQGLAIGVLGSFIGLAVGVLISYNINTIFFVGESLAARFFMSSGSFYFTSLPVKVVWADTVSVMLSAWVCSWVATGLAARKSLKLKPLESLRLLT